MLTTGPKGITAKARKQVVAEMIGAKMKTALSAAVGMMSSFNANLMPSANPCSKPKGPTRFGPMRCCMRATTRRSAQIITNVLTTRKTKMTTALISDNHQGVSARASVTVTAAFIAHRPRLATPGRLSSHPAHLKSPQ